ncbi:MAG: hypothetical protein HY748_14745 [Elusimicrobia bacterium]|nr:hypothetical protein [Elusimicrobiota bacterium]
MCEDYRHKDDCDCYDCVETRMGRRGGSCCCRPEDRGFDVVAMWKDAFHLAYREVQVEIFKAKIKTAMGKTMDKAAGLVLESMLAEIRDSQKKTQAAKASKEKLDKLVKEALGA